MEKAASQDKDAEMAIQRATLVLRLREGINSLARVLKVIEVSEFVKKIRQKIESYKRFIIFMVLLTVFVIFRTEWKRQCCPFGIKTV